MLTRRQISLGLGAIALCAGCSTRSGNGFRAVSKPLSTTTRADQSALSGQWYVRGFFPGDESLSRVTFLPNVEGSPGIKIDTQSCLLGADCIGQSHIHSLKKLGPNRALVEGTGREIWLVWIDEGQRTAAIGTPGGGFGWILDRRPTGGQDRISAAREVLDFNGYDISQMALRGTG
ncbi:MAG: lipocalin [Pseudomonadota bacterium]